MLASSHECTGCSACVSVCPQGCLTMKAGDDGFLYPHLDDETLCLHCGACSRVCPIMSRADGLPVLGAYAGTLSNRSELYRSASGGAFFALADNCIRSGGVVYGAAFDENLRVKHLRVDSIEDLERLRKSKYSQSDIGVAYVQCREDIAAGRQVLFSGTPCQIAGLDAFLSHKEYPSLLKVQVFCGQVISPLVLDRYLHYIQEEAGDEATAFDFRYKEPEDASIHQSPGSPPPGWKRTCVKASFRNGTERILPWSEDVLMNAFMAGLLLRSSCLNCRFKFEGRIYADLSIGDFGGVELTNPSCFDGLGVSAILTHSQKGETALHDVCGTLRITKVKIQDVFAGNPGVCRSIAPHPNRDSFYAGIREETGNVAQYIRNHLGFLAAHPGRHYRIGVFGSHFTRLAVIKLCAGSDSTLAYHYSNSSLISLMSPPCAWPEDVSLPSNPFRSMMVQCDFDKAFLHKKDSCNVDFLVVDLLEERFGLIAYQGSIVTDSDACRDSDFRGEGTLSRSEDGKISLLWSKACKDFISYLKKNIGFDKVILVKAYLAEKYVDHEGNVYEFEEIERIREINRILDLYYLDLTKAGVYRNIKPREQQLIYSDKNYKHGCYPYHFNEDYIRHLAEALLEQMI